MEQTWKQGFLANKELLDHIGLIASQKFKIWLIGLYTNNLSKKKGKYQDFEKGSPNSYHQVVLVIRRQKIYNY